MSLFCCGNWRFVAKHNKKNKKNSFTDISNFKDVEKNSSNKNQVTPEHEDESLLNNSSNCVDNVAPETAKVIFRADTIYDMPPDGIQLESGEESLTKIPSTRSNYILKSVLHRSSRFNHDLHDAFVYNDDGKQKQAPLHKPFVATSRRGSLYIFRNADDIIITPFAQILASLRKVRANFMIIANINSSNDDKRNKSEQFSKPKEPSPNTTKSDVTTKLAATETLNELEWCLDRLENIQTHRSVSDMASTKFKQIINRELSQYAETSKSGHQISDYICKTFLDSPQDDNMPEATSAERVVEEIDDSRRNELSKYGPKLFKANTDPMLKKNDSDSVILDNADSQSGIGALEDQFSTDNLPLLGVNVPNEEDAIEMINQNLLKWGMDLFSFTKITNGKSLVVISYAIFKHHNLINKFQINNKILVQFLIRVENSYRSEVPYHNSIHAADVTQSANVLLNGPAIDNVFSDLEILSVIFACIIHDMDHPGVTNQYLVNSNSDLATLYNDSSVLENHHLATAFQLLTNKECDFLTTLSRRQKQSMRRMVIDMVLATDMSKHMTLLADLKTMVETKKVAGSGILTLDTYTDRIQILQNLVHCSDLSNPTKPLLLYQTWTERIMEEFFRQGDKERESDLEISPMCDRQTATVEKSQVSFIDFIVHPLWETWSELVYPDSQEILDTLEENRRWYYTMSQEKERDLA